MASVSRPFCTTSAQTSTLIAMRQSAANRTGFKCRPSTAPCTATTTLDIPEFPARPCAAAVSRTAQCAEADGPYQLLTSPRQAALQTTDVVAPLYPVTAHESARRAVILPLGGTAPTAAAMIAILPCTLAKEDAKSPFTLPETLTELLTTPYGQADPDTAQVSWMDEETTEGTSVSQMTLALIFGLICTADTAETPRTPLAEQANTTCADTVASGVVGATGTKLKLAPSPAGEK